MTAITVTAHRARIRPDVQQWMSSTTLAMIGAVERHFRRRLEPVTLVLTDTRGCLDQYWQAATALADGQRPERRLRRLNRKEARHSAAMVTINPDGGTILVLDATSRSMRRSETAALVLAHELVHCDQYGRPGVRPALIAGIRHNLGVQVDNDRARDINRMVGEHEREAYRLERPLAEQGLRAVA